MERSQDSLDFQEIWNTFRQGHEMIPRRSDIKPERFHKFLPFMSVAEVIGDDQLIIRLAGTTIRDYIGFELTGQNFLDYDADQGPGLGPQVRRNYHDWPCGRFERVGIMFKENLRVECDLTILPVWGMQEERLLFILIEPSEVRKLEIENDALLYAQQSSYIAPIDIGAGVPDV